MGRYLIVANQTMGGAELEQKLRDRIESGASDFYIIVPVVEPALETSTWLPSDPAFGIPDQTERAAEAMEEARRRSQHRLSRMIGKIEELGGQAEGQLGESDPVEAVRTVLDRELFDEVIVSTLPAGISRWLKLDLPSRIQRLVDCPVTTVEAEG